MDAMETYIAEALNSKRQVVDASGSTSLQDAAFRALQYINRGYTAQIQVRVPTGLDGQEFVGTLTYTSYNVRQQEAGVWPKPRIETSED